jgi:hypothetical protein
MVQPAFSPRGAAAVERQLPWRIAITITAVRPACVTTVTLPGPSIPYTTNHSARSCDHRAGWRTIPSGLVGGGRLPVTRATTTALTADTFARTSTVEYVDMNQSLAHQDYLVCS